MSTDVPQMKLSKGSRSAAEPKPLWRSSGCYRQPFTPDASVTISMIVKSQYRRLGHLPLKLYHFLKLDPKEFVREMRHSPPPAKPLAEHGRDLGLQRSPTIVDRLRFSGAVGALLTGGTAFTRMTAPCPPSPKTGPPVNCHRSPQIFAIAAGPSDLTLTCLAILDVRATVGVRAQKHWTGLV